jgi:hypothetical protein
MSLSSDNDAMPTILYILAIIFVCVLMPCRGFMASEQAAVDALTSAGYTDIEILDHQFACVTIRGCGSDAAKFPAKAKNPQGKEVKLYVCVGWPFKGSTIRFGE